MTNMEATYLYRRETAAAITRYSASLRTIFKAHGSPIPPGPDCACAMGNAWALCRVDFYKADQRLALARLAWTSLQRATMRSARPDLALTPC